MNHGYVVKAFQHRKSIEDPLDPDPDFSLVHVATYFVCSENETIAQERVRAVLPALGNDYSLHATQHSEFCGVFVLDEASRLGNEWCGSLEK